jgi:hypothetical protein
MVLTKQELIDSLKNEVRIWVHLCSKIEPKMADYRPAPKQRSTLELLRYMNTMAPALVEATKTGAFDPAKFTAMTDAASKLDLAGAAAGIAKQADTLAAEIGSMSDEDMRGKIEMFGQPYTRGAFLTNLVLCGFAAYRTQLFLYLKACGREDLSTMNLWGGMDAPAAAS